MAFFFQIRDLINLLSMYNWRDQLLPHLYFCRNTIVAWIQTLTSAETWSEIFCIPNCVFTTEWLCKVFEKHQQDFIRIDINILNTLNDSFHHQLWWVATSHYNVCQCQQEQNGYYNSAYARMPSQTRKLIQKLNSKTASRIYCLSNTRSYKMCYITDKDKGFTRQTNSGGLTFNFGWNCACACV